MSMPTLRVRYRNPSHDLGELAYASAWVIHAYKLSSLGTGEITPAITRAWLVAYRVLGLVRLPVPVQ